MTMRWFQHRHWWREKNSMRLCAGGVEKGELIVEECSCGAIRTIEVFPGRQPIVRFAKCEESVCDNSSKEEASQ